MALEEEKQTGVNIHWYSLTMSSQKCENTKQMHAFEVFLVAKTYIKCVFVHVIKFIKICGGERSAGGDTLYVAVLNSTSDMNNLYTVETLK